MLSLLMVHLVFTGCAFLKYETKEQAIAAIEALNGVHKMEVLFAVQFLSLTLSHQKPLFFFSCVGHCKGNMGSWLIKFMTGIVQFLCEFKWNFKIIQ